ncbi:hypothetical protein [Streptomyces sp. BK208]
MPLLKEAFAFGRPHSAVLLQQKRHLSAPRGTEGYGGLVADVRYQGTFCP